MPVSDRDLAISLAVNEAEQPATFLKIARQIEVGGRIQLSSKDLESLLSRLESSGLKKMLGRGQTQYVKRDVLEELLCLAARDAVIEFEKFLDSVLRVAGAVNVDVKVISGMAGVSAKRSVCRSLSDSDDITYAERAFLYRFGKELCMSSRFNLDEEGRAIMALKLKDISDAIEPVLTRIHTEHENETEEYFASLVIQDKTVLERVLNTEPQLILSGLYEFEDRLDERRYGARLQ